VAPKAATVGKIETAAAAGASKESSPPDNRRRRSAQYGGERSPTERVVTKPATEVWLVSQKCSKWLDQNVRAFPDQSLAALDIAPWGNPS